MQAPGSRVTQKQPPYDDRLAYRLRAKINTFSRKALCLNTALNAIARLPCTSHDFLTSIHMKRQLLEKKTRQPHVRNFRVNTDALKQWHIQIGHESSNYPAPSRLRLDKCSPGSCGSLASVELTHFSQSPACANLLGAPHVHIWFAIALHCTSLCIAVVR